LVTHSAVPKIKELLNVKWEVIHNHHKSCN
jgi:hypothetical protein